VLNQCPYPSTRAERVLLPTFLPRDAMLARCMLSCVRPSVTSRHCTKTEKIGRRPGTRFLTPKISAKFQLRYPLRTGAPSRGGVGSNWRFSTNISLYLRNGARWRQSYYGTLIGTCMRSRMALFPMTLGDPYNYSKPPHLSPFISS